MTAHKLGEAHTYEWLNGTAQWYLSDELPDLPVTASFVFVESQDSLALTHVTKRGWDLPGGHVDPGESALYAAIRETQEEIGLTLTKPLTTVGYLEIDQVSDKYPASSIMAFFRVRIDEQLPLVASLECDNVAWVPLHQIASLCAHKPWLILYHQL